MAVCADTVLVVTRSPSIGGIAPILSALGLHGVTARVVDLAVPIETITVRSDGSAELTQESGDIFRLNHNSRILLWHEGQPSFTGDMPDEIDEASFVERCRRQAWAELLSIPALWVNPASARRAIGQNKLLQTRIATDIGLATIETVLTNSIAEYENAVSSMGPTTVALKSPVQWHSWGSDSAPARATYTRRLDVAEAIELAPLAEFAPVYIQPYVDKDYELRITVVGDRVFSCRIDSQASERARVDWRHYDLEEVQHSEYTLPLDVERDVRRMVERAGLVYAALDFIVEADGTFRFVELNPSGQYGWIEALTGMPISNAIAEVLVEAH